MPLSLDPEWLSAYTAAYNLQTRLHADQRPDTDEIDDVISRLRTAAANPRTVGTVEEIEAIRAIALLLIDVAGYADQQAAADALTVAFDEIYLATSRALSLAWAGDSRVQRQLPYALRTLARVCYFSESFLTEERLSAAVGAFRRVAGLDAVANDLVWMHSMVLAELAASKASPVPDAELGTDVGQAADGGRGGWLIGPPKGPDAASIAAKAEVHSGWAVELFQLACEGLAGRADCEAPAETSSVARSCSSSILRALTRTSIDAVVCFKAVVSWCNLVDEISVKLADIPLESAGAGGTASQPGGLGQALVDDAAEFAGAMLRSFVDEMGADLQLLHHAPRWIAEARQLTERYWPADDVVLATELGDSPLTPPQRLSAFLNSIEFATISNAFEESMDRMDRMFRHRSRDQTEPGIDAEAGADPDDETFWLWVAESVVMLSDNRRPMVVRAVANILSGPDDIDLEARIQGFLDWLRPNEPDRPLWQAMLLDDRFIANPTDYLRLIENMVTDAFLPGLEADEDLETVLSQVLALMTPATSDYRFMSPDPIDRLVRLARRIEAHPAAAGLIDAPHILARALFMARDRDLDTMRELQAVTRKYLRSLGSRPGPENLHCSRDVIEVVRFAAEATASLSATKHLGGAESGSGVETSDFAGLIGALQAWAVDPRVDEEAQEFAAVMLAELAVLGHDIAVDGDPDFAALARRRPEIYLAALINRGSSSVTAAERDLAHVTIRTLSVEGSSRFPLNGWAALLTSKTSRALHLSNPTRLSLARRLLSEILHPTPTTARGGLALVLSLNDLLDDHTLGTDTEALTESAGHLVRTAALDCPNRDVHNYLATRAGRGISLAVTGHDRRTRVMVAMAAYAMAVWLDDPDAAAQDAHIVGEYFRHTGHQTEAEWWHGLYDHWRVQGALEGPAYANQRRNIEQDRGGPSQAGPMSDTTDDWADRGPSAESDRLIDELWVQVRDSQGVITPELLELLDRAAAIDAGASLTLRTWRIALSACRTATGDEVEAVTPIAAAIANGLLGSRRFNEGSLWIASIPVLAALIEVLALCRLFGTARRALVAYRERLNQFAIAHLDEESYLTSRPDTSLRGAVLSAFDHCDLDLALQCAETGRLKLMMSMATKAAQGPGGSLDLADLPSHEHPVAPVLSGATGPRSGDVAAVGENPSSTMGGDLQDPPFELLQPYDLGYDDFNAALLAMRGQPEAARWIRGLSCPWREMPAASATPLRPAGPLAAGDWRSWLVEPHGDAVAAAAGPGRTLLYPVFDNSWIGVIVVRDDRIKSFQLSQEHIAETELDIASPEGAQLAGAMTAAELLLDANADFYLISWCAEDEIRFRHFLHGFRRLQDVRSRPPTDLVPAEANQNVEDPTSGSAPQSAHVVDDTGVTRADPSGDSLDEVQVEAAMPLVNPSYRLLGSPEAPAITEPQRVVFLGDSIGDLVGPWVEAAAWRQLHGSRVVTHLGTAVTRQTLIESFSSADLLVLSLHARMDGNHGDPVLATADGPISFADVLLEGRTVPRQLVLSSCSAGRAAQHAPADEVVGLATSLLMRGATRVLAPMVAINDGLAATLGCLLASAMLDLSDLRTAWTHIAALADASPQWEGWTLGDIVGAVDIDPEFPHPRTALDRVLRRPVTALRDVAEQYVLFGT